MYMYMYMSRFARYRIRLEESVSPPPPPRPTPYRAPPGRRAPYTRELSREQRRASPALDPLSGMSPYMRPAPQITCPPRAPHCCASRTPLHRVRGSVPHTARPQSHRYAYLSPLLRTRLHAPWKALWMAPEGGRMDGGSREGRARWGVLTRPNAIAGTHAHARMRLSVAIPVRLCPAGFVPSGFAREDGLSGCLLSQRGASCHPARSMPLPHLQHAITLAFSPYAAPPPLARPPR